MIYSFFLVLVSFEPTTAAASPTDGEAFFISVDVAIIQDVYTLSYGLFIDICTYCCSFFCVSTF